MKNNETFHHATLRALEIITLRLGRTSDTFMPAHDGSEYPARGCSFWWTLKACPLFLDHVREQHPDECPDGLCGHLIFLEECLHGKPSLRVNVDCIHDDELPAVYAIMGQLRFLGYPVITEYDDVDECEDDEDIQVAGTA